MKTFRKLMLITALTCSMAACGGNANQAPTGETAESAASEETVEKIDFSSEKGSVKFIGFEKADPKLTDDDNDDALVFTFEYTNLQNEVKQFQKDFRLEFFQNGAELNQTPTYSGEAKKQYELVGAFFDKALEGGKITFGKIVLPEDDSPITVLLEGNGETYSTVFQKMEVDIKPGSAPAETKSEGPDAETVKSALQGTWVHEASGGTFSFTGDNVSVNNGDLKGTFTVDLDAGVIECTVNASDGKLRIKLPFEYKNNALTLENNRGERLKKR